VREAYVAVPVLFCCAKKRWGRISAKILGACHRDIEEERRLPESSAVLPGLRSEGCAVERVHIKRLSFLPGQMNGPKDEIILIY